MNTISIALLFFSATFSALASVAIKYSDRLFKLNYLNISIINKLPAVLLYAVGFILYSLALKHSPVSKAYPVMVSFAVFQLLALGWYFGEEINMKLITGAIIILIGIFIINFK